MRYQTESLGLIGSVTPILRDLIHDRLGLMYEPHQFDLVADRLAPLVVARGLSSFLDYYYLLKYAEEPGEWLKVMDALAIQETYFWREIDQLRAVVSCLVAPLVEALKGRPLRMWSVPCATGEEPLTLAMLLAEAGWFERAPIELIASDASPAAIERARIGHYTQRSFRNLPPELREKYFTAHEGYRTIDPALARHVSYDVVNLMNEHQVARHGTSPIVICRNLFIYFSDRSIRRVLTVLERSMPTPSYLCVGASESLLRRTTIFDLQDIGGAFIYVKDTSSRRAAALPHIERAS